MGQCVRWIIGSNVLRLRNQSYWTSCPYLEGSERDGQNRFCLVQILTFPDATELGLFGMFVSRGLGWGWFGYIIGRLRMLSANSVFLFNRKKGKWSFNLELNPFTYLFLYNADFHANLYFPYYIVTRDKSRLINL